MCTLICIITMATILCKLTSLSSWDCFSSHQSIVKRNMIWWRVCVKTEKKLKKRILKKKNCAHFSPYFFFLREKQKQPNEKLNKTKFVSMFSEWYTYFLHIVILAYVTWGHETYCTTSNITHETYLFTEREIPKWIFFISLIST